jgi:hypothetical protein
VSSPLKIASRPRPRSKSCARPWAAPGQSRAAKGATNAQWPSLNELQENRYDLDGDGPSEVMQALLPQGLPDNLLTESRGGVLPYCEEPPSQAALQEVDADWHYCDINGRLFATAGFTKEATLNW